MQNMQKKPLSGLKIINAVQSPQTVSLMKQSEAESAYRKYRKYFLEWKEERDHIHSQQLQG